MEGPWGPPKLNGSCPVPGKRVLAEELKDEFDTFEGDELPENKCCLCATDFRGFGHDAWPVRSGRACDECNPIVVKQRIMKFNFTSK